MLQGFSTYTNRCWLVAKLFSQGIRDNVRKAGETATRAAWLVAGTSTPPVFIYQMGKVGSVSIRDSLQRCWHGPVVHAHSIRSFRLRGLDTSALYARYLQHNAKRSLFIITLVREPISRNISQFFESIKRTEVLELNAQALVNYFIDNFNHTLTLRWFDKFFYPYIGIDVYQKPFFNPSVVLQRGNIRVLILKTEADDIEKEVAISEFLGLTGFKIARSNTAETRSFGTKQQAFKKIFVPPVDYVDSLYSSKYFKHFYGDEESEWRDHWLNRHGM